MRVNIWGRVSAGATQGEAARSWCRDRSRLASEHPLGGLSLGRGPSLEGSGICPVFGEAHGKAGMRVTSSSCSSSAVSRVALALSLTPAPSQESDPPAQLQNPSLLRA